ncbi:hypothetical protein JVX91_16945 [Pseudomonas sp. PDNC002]|uniref:hypothetical protein n=1 Tax=Pseudomonas sp. PDNC002 TaxID=2811422 RepID=UPI001964F70C|nr:hypothetical protein [Pseudomonas sp. PDNC002]QRY77297.1 hypothetical protein JVX91_16945 [Pseudomonas sp. PDNC002]
MQPTYTPIVFNRFNYPLRAVLIDNEPWFVAGEFSAAYRVIYFYMHPENRNMRQWLTREVVPTLRDASAPTAWRPLHTLMTLEGARLMLLNWRGDLWLRLREMPRFSTPREVPTRRSLGQWLRR